jgi:pre-rRNA-processing protein TSR4
MSEFAGKDSFEERAQAAFASRGINISDLGTAEDWIGEGSENDDEEDDVETPYQLGFPEEGVNSLHAERDWRDWDGGKIGGKPCWLDPCHLPHAEALQCSECDGPMRFVLQLYCPLDEIEGAFHRSLYLFMCGKSPCVSKGSVRCLRAQLPRRNSFYPYDPSVADAATDSPHSDDSTLLPGLCEVCGCRGAFSCSACKAVRYCCKAHQKQHYKLHKPLCTIEGSDTKGKVSDETDEVAGMTSFALDSSALKRLVFPEYDLVVSAEVLAKDSAADIESSTTIWEDAHTQGGADEADDLALQQKDYDEALGNKARDPEYLKFLARVRRGGSDQVLRYCRWEDDSGALPISIDAAHPYEPPACERCGSPRAFEFQVMPQLLYFLKVDSGTHVAAPGADEARSRVAANETVALGEVMSNNKSEDIEWGTLDVYTCTGSCGLSGHSDGYHTEHVRFNSGGGLE